MADSDLEPLWQAGLDPVAWARTEAQPLLPETLAQHRERRGAPDPGTAASAVEAALSAYRAVGFVEEGWLRERARVEGRYDDVVLLAVLRSDEEV